MEQRTIGVLSNRQLYLGSTISRYEQILLRGVRAAAHQHGCRLLLACGVGPDSTPFEELPAWPACLPQTTFVPVGPWNTDGMLAIPPFTQDQLRALGQLLPPGFPVVFTYPQAGYPSVGPANSLGIAEAFAHLLEHGHRRIAFLTTDAHPVGDAAERLEAYRTALEAAGLPFDPKLLGYGGHNVHDSRRALRQMLAAGVEFTALLASNDESAIGALQALAEAGRRVPEDVAVIGFDDVLYAKVQEPPLTTVRHPTFELGYRALELLLEHIAGGEAEASTLRVPTRLIVRESCGCLPYSAPAPGEAAPQAKELDMGALLAAMEEAVAGEARQPQAPGAPIRRWCETLVERFAAALRDGDPALWAAALDRLLHDAEAAGEELYPWQTALSALRVQLDLLLPALAPSSSCSAGPACGSASACGARTRACCSARPS